MNYDGLSKVITLLIAGVIILFGLVAVFLLTKEGEVSGDAALGLFSATIGGAVAYVFAQRAAEQSQKAFETGLATPTANTITNQGTPNTITPPTP